MPKSSRKGKRRWSPPTPLVYLLLFTRLSGSSFLASAQYIDKRSESSGWGSRGSHIDPKRDQSSNSRSIWLESYDDFCLYGPPEPFNYIWSSGLNVVSWCAKDGHGTRLIPDGTIQGVTFVRTSDWVQVSGFGDFTKINIAPGDAGGQFDSETHTPEGAQVTVNGQVASSWVTLISSDAFCMRACTGDQAYCPSTYDQMGCWFLTGNAVGPSGTYQNCEADSGDPPGVVNGQTYTQGSQPTPEPFSPELRNCQPGGSIANGQAAPPMQTWSGQPADDGDTNSSGDTSGSAVNGTGDSAPASGDAAANETGTGEDESSPVGSEASTTWLPVETCAPCEQDENSAPSPTSASTAASSSGSASDSSGAGTTEQVGVTQVSPPAGAGALLTSAEGSGGTSASSSSSSASSATQAPNDALSRRQAEGSGEGDAAASEGNMDAGGDGSGNAETTTKNGQCCHTTWTPSVFGGAGPTGSISASASDPTATGGVNATSTSRNQTGSRGSLGGVTPSGTLRVGGTGPSASLNSSGRVAGGLGAGSNSTNGTGGNGTGNGSGAGLRADIVGLEGAWRVMLASGAAVGVAAVFGGWSLV